MSGSSATAALLESRWIRAVVLALASAGASAGQAAAQAVPQGLMDRVAAIVDADVGRLQDAFRDIHQHPELGFMEVRTAGIIADELRALGFEVQTEIGQTGVVGILRNGTGPVVMYRADMDANAVEEATGLPYESTVRVTRPDGVEVPVAHLCGHDAHVVWMLGVAKAMVELRDEWSGTLVLVGQPAEEPIMGAKAMVADGLYTDRGVPVPDYLVALHTSPIPTGTVTVTSGELNAGTDQLDVTFHGIGGHGSSPHLTKDPVVMATAAVMQYQAIVSRGVNPLNAAVITVGSIQAGQDNNVIPASALLKINLRWYDPADRELMLAGIDRINASIASAYALPDSLFPTTTMKGGSVVLSNDAGMATAVQPALRSLLGAQAVLTDFPKLMGSEDAHHLVLDNPTHRVLYMYVGTADPDDVARAQSEGRAVPYSNHNPDYRVDLDAIPVGAKIGTLSALTLFNGSVPD